VTWPQDSASPIVHQNATVSTQHKLRIGSSVRWCYPLSGGLRSACTHETQDDVQVAVADAREAADWYKRALGATELWSLGSVVGLAIGDAL
jgi:hypothetical protein